MRENRGQLAVIDCAIKNASHLCFNRLLQELDRPLSYHRPPMEGLKSLYENEEFDQGYIIFGSASNIEDQLPWHSELAEFCLSQLQKGKPVFGICFGHQLMAHQFGLEVSLNKNEKTYKGAREVEILQDCYGVKKGERYKIFTAHSFEVVGSHEDLIHFGTSSECFNDGLAHRTLPYMGVQGHPEASLHFVANEILEKNPNLPEEAIDQALADGPSLLRTFFANVSQ